MVRLLFWIAVITVGIWLWRRYKRASETRQQPRKPDAPAPMVRCTTCGIHVPEQQALTQDGQWYCSHAHLPKPETNGGQ